MNMYLGMVTPFEFEGYLLIPLSGAWRKVSDNLSFDVSINKGRLLIKSNQSIQK
jgi:hypothetical protein